jgi:DNA-binding XRE family transcriptional regulator
MSADRGSFGEVLRRVRSGAALSQEALAERAGLSKRGISDLERGARLAPRLETVRLLADALSLGDADRLALLAAARPALLRHDALGGVPLETGSVPGTEPVTTHPTSGTVTLCMSRRPAPYRSDGAIGMGLACASAAIGACVQIRSWVPSSGVCVQR